MLRVRVLCVCLLVCNLVCQPLSAGTSTISLRRQEAGAIIRGKKVTVIPTSGAKKSGLVIDLEPDLTLEGAGAIPWADIKEIRFVEYSGDGRRIGKKIGGAVGLMGGILGAVAVGMDETSAHKSRDKAVATGLAVGGLPFGLVLGYLAGRRADKETTIITIAPEPAAPAATVMR